MNMTLLRRTIASFIAVMAGSSPLRASRAVQPDPSVFSFRFVARHCLAESYDSSTGVFMKELSPRGIPRPSSTTRLILTSAQTEAISAKIDAIEFFAYPSRFTDASPRADTVMTIPYTSYRLDVHSAERHHTVFWDDATRPRTPREDRLLELLSLMIGVIHDNPDYKRLPRGMVGCM